MLLQFEDLKDLIISLSTTNKLDCSSISEQFNLLEIWNRCHYNEHEIALLMYKHIITSIIEKYEHYHIFSSFMEKQFEGMVDTLEHLEHIIMDDMVMFGEANALLNITSNIIQIEKTIGITHKYPNNKEILQSKMNEEQEVSNIIQTIVEISELYLNMG